MKTENEKIIALEIRKLKCGKTTTEILLYSDYAKANIKAMEVIDNAGDNYNVYTYNSKKDAVQAMINMGGEMEMETEIAQIKALPEGKIAEIHSCSPLRFESYNEDVELNCELCDDWGDVTIYCGEFDYDEETIEQLRKEESYYSDIESDEDFLLAIRDKY